MAHSSPDIATFGDQNSISSPVKRVQIKRYKCPTCPAAFIKSALLIRHVSLHGGSGKFVCKHCNYAVDHLGNLTRHALVHASPETADTLTPTGQPVSVASIPNFHNCSKCPARFNKINRYKLHARFHGCNQKFRCELCDYAVNYAPTLMKHRKLHFQARRLQSPYRQPLTAVHTQEQVPNPDAPTDVFEPTTAEQQQIILQHHQLQVQLLQQQKRKLEECVRVFRCDRCPYTHSRKDAVHSHRKRHLPLRGCNMCSYCDYNTNLPSFVREHEKIHLRPWKSNKIDAVMKAEHYEIWSCSNGVNTLLFKDNGERKNGRKRFVFMGEEEEGEDEDLDEVLEKEAKKLNFSIDLSGMDNIDMDEIDVADDVISNGEVGSELQDSVRDNEGVNFTKESVNMRFQKENVFVKIPVSEDKLITNDIEIVSNLVKNCLTDVVEADQETNVSGRKLGQSGETEEIIDNSDKTKDIKKIVEKEHVKYNGKVESNVFDNIERKPVFMVDRIQRPIIKKCDNSSLDDSVKSNGIPQEDNHIHGISEV